MRELRTRIVISIFIAVILLALLTTSSTADTLIVLPQEDKTTIEPTVFANISRLGSGLRRDEPAGLCASNDGTVFTVNIDPAWPFIRGAAQASLIAWRSDGTLLWSKTFTTWQMKLFGIATDNSYVYVTGDRGGNLFVGKYDLLGNSILNVSYDLGGADCGREISISSGGDIIVWGGPVPVFRSFLSDHFLVVLDSGGGIEWQRIFQNYAVVACDTNNIYTIHNSSLQKYDSNGTVLWSAECDEECGLYVKNDILYSVTEQEQTFHTSLSIKSWNPENGEIQWSSNTTICKEHDQLLNTSCIRYSVSQNGNLLIFMDELESGKWHLLALTEEGTLAWNHTLLDTSWHSVHSIITDSGKFIVVGSRKETRLTMAVFYIDAENSEHLDIVLVSITLVGVVAFDATLIIFLRKRNQK